MKRVILESPYASTATSSRWRNEEYGLECLKDSLHRGEAPFAAHLLYTRKGVLEDSDPDQRRMGMKAAREWYKISDAVVVYTDLGISPGMEVGIENAATEGVPVIFRRIYKEGDEV